jgi:hypothetical protein
MAILEGIIPAFFETYTNLDKAGKADLYELQCIKLINLCRIEIHDPAYIYSTFLIQCEIKYSAYACQNKPVKSNHHSFFSSRAHKLIKQLASQV